MVSSGSIGSLAKALHEVLRYVIDATAVRLPIQVPVASVSWDLTEYVLPALPVWTISALWANAGKPVRW